MLMLAARAGPGPTPAGHANRAYEVFGRHRLEDEGVRAFQAGGWWLARPDAIEKRSSIVVGI